MGSNKHPTTAAAVPPRRKAPGRHDDGGVPGSEADLARLWAAQAFGADRLATADGTAVEVAYPGRPGGRSGPDFRDAVVRVGDAPARVGDVELHREARDFTRHGHAANPAYDRVILHVVFTPNDAPATTLHSGRAAPMVAVSRGDSPRPVPRREPCAAAPARHGVESVGAVLHDAGRWRLERKAAAMASAIARDGPGQALYAGLAVALGQTVNARAFALLAERAPLADLLDGLDAADEDGRTEALRARLLRSAGLDGALLAPAPVLPWLVGGLRPAAHPARRIAALARLVARLSRPDLVAGARDAVTRARSEGPAALVRVLTVRAGVGPALCGRGRAVEVAVNALLPWASACAEMSGNGDAAYAILLLARGLPAGESYGVTAHLRRNLRDARGRTLVTSALAQQGALAMLGEWCRRGGCGRCPLS